MTTEEKEAFILRLKEYDKMRFCLVIILYYQKNINGITDLTQITSRNLLVNLPSGIRKVIALYHFDERIGVMEAGQLEKLLNKICIYFNKKVQSIFSLWNILFSQFAGLYAFDQELMLEVFSELAIPCLEDLRKLLYVGENFNEDSLSELLCILIQIKNYQEIHLINYDIGSISLNICLERVRDALGYMQPDDLEMMLKRIIIVEEPQLSFAYLNTYIEQNATEKFIIVIGMERLVEFFNNSEINITLMKCNFNLGTSDVINWELLINKISNLYELLKEKNSFLLTVYIVDNVMDEARQKISSFCKNGISFDVLFDQTRSINAFTQDKKLFDKLLVLIFNGDITYEQILEQENKLSQDNFTILKTYFYLSRNDYFHAILELKLLSEDTDLFFQFLLAELYNITGKTRAAYTIFKKIYAKDKYYPNLVNSIVYSLRDSENKEEQFYWIKKGLEINPYDPVLVQHLANYYTWTEDYMASAQQWKMLYDMTGDLFFSVLCEINYILASADKSQLHNIHVWVEEKVTNYPQYADEINSRIGIIIFNKIHPEDALFYFERVKISYEECFCIAAEKILEIYCRMYSRKVDKKIKQSDMQGFAQKLLKYMLIMTYSTQSVYSWSSYILKLFSYDEWLELSNRLLIERLVKLAKGCLEGDAKTTKLVVNETSTDNLEHCFENYEGSMTLNLEGMTTDEYLLILLAQGKSKISKGEIQAANDIAYTFFRQASMSETYFYKDINMCFGLLIWVGACMAIGASVEGIFSFAAAVDRLIEIQETAVLHEYGFVFDQFLYLNNTTLENSMDFSNLKLFEKYFDCMGYPKVLLYCIFRMYEKILKLEPQDFKKMIHQMQEVNIVLLAKNESLDQIIFYDSLISSYFKTNQLDKAGIYLQRLYPSIIMTLMDHIDIAYHFLIRFTDILMKWKDFHSTRKILALSLQIVEKLRGLSFHLERSFLGDPADVIIRRFLYLCCEENDFLDESMESEELLWMILINMVPKSIIEQKNGNDKVIIDETLLAKEREYYLLFEQLGNAKKKSVSDHIYKQTADRFLEIKKYLEEHHPNYKPLSTYTLIGWNDGNPFVFLESKLNKSEIFYRNILAEDYLIHILITQNTYHISSEKLNLSELEELLRSLKKNIDENVYDLERMQCKTYVSLFERLTEMLFQPLVNQIGLKDTLYYMPDYKLRHITPNFIRTNEKWGVEYFNKIELVIDYNNIGNSKRESKQWSNLFYMSDSTKGGLQEIRKTMCKYSDFKELKRNKSDQIEISESVKILVIAAHGVSEEFGKPYYGAKKLELSKKKQIDLYEFITLHSATVENAIIIACSGGTPTNDKIERNNGVWDSMFRKNVRFILYCKWDVSTKHTNLLLDIILKEMQVEDRLLSEALNMAQRKMTDLNPVLWAGLEVWKN